MGDSDGTSAAAGEEGTWIAAAAVVAVPLWMPRNKASSVMRHWKPSLA